MKYKIIFFDFDGTLIDTLPDIAIAVNHSLKKTGINELALSQIRDFIGEGSRVLIKKCLEIQKNTYSDETLGQIHESFINYYKRNCYKASKVYAGVIDTLKKIDSIKIIFTNKPYLITKKICIKTGMIDFFNEIISPETFNIKKPDPRPVFKMAEKYKTNYDEMLLVGDSIYDIECSENAGIKNCIVKYGYSKPEDIKKADILIDKFDEIINII